MIIGFDASRAFSDKRTGTENYSYQLLKALAKIDHVNQYIVYLRPNSVIPAKAGMTKEGWPDNFKFEILNFKFLWTQVGLSLQTFTDKLDVLFVPAHTLPLIRKPGLKTVVTVHDLGSEYLPQTHQLKQRLYLGLMQKYQLKTATKIISVSKATRDDLVKKLGIRPESVTVVYEGYDKEIFRPIPQTLNPKPYFLFVGTVQPRKNLTRVIQAFSRVILNEVKDLKIRKAKPRDSSASPQNDNFKLVIAGSKGWMSDEIYKLPKQLGIEDRVRFLPPQGGRVGYVPDEKLPALYSGAEALVFPSLFEGFGLPILEAQACGCPVITSNISSMPEVAGKGAILVNPYSVDDIVKGMERVKREGERVKLIKAGFENVKRFSWEKCAEETLKVLGSA